MKVATLNNSVDETTYSWEKMPSKTFIAGEEKSMPGFKASKDRLTLSLGTIATSDLKLKLMLISHPGNPRALKNYVPSALPVLYRWNNKAAHLLTT